MYDYIIVGAGSAGCVLANRLTEDPSVKVLLLEAGGADSRREIHIPAAFSKLFQTSCDWAYFTEAEPQLENRKLYWPRGKVLGGSSSRSEEHTSELQSRPHLVCRLLLEKKKQHRRTHDYPSQYKTYTIK